MKNLLEKWWTIFAQIVILSRGPLSVHPDITKVYFPATLVDLERRKEEHTRVVYFFHAESNGSIYFALVSAHLSEFLAIFSFNSSFL